MRKHRTIVILILLLALIITGYIMNNAYLFSAALLSFYIFGFGTWSYVNFKKQLSKRSQIGLYLIIGASIFWGLFFLHWYSLNDTNIKIYDDINSYLKVLERYESYRINVQDYLHFVRDTLANDYTHIDTLLLAPVAWVVPYSYSVHCTAVYILYYIPATMALLMIALKIYNGIQKSKPLSSLQVSISFLLILLSANMFYPLLNGFDDVWGLMFVGLLICQTFDIDYTKYSFKQVVSLSILSFLVILVRRWYAYFIIGFYLSFFLDLLIIQWKQRKLDRKQWGVLIATEGTIAALSIVALSFLNSNIIPKFLSNYSDQYEAYASSEISTRLMYLVNNFGYLLIGMAFLGAYVALKRPATFSITNRLITTVVIAMGIFATVQEMDFHHQYLIVWFLVVFAAFIYMYTINNLYLHHKRFTLLVASIILFNAVFPISTKTNSVQAYTNPLTTGLEAKPEAVTSETKSLYQLDSYLKTTMNDQNEFAYAVGDMKQLSSESFKRLYLPETVDNFPNMLETANADKRDGFPSYFFQAEYVVLSDPLASWYPEKQIEMLGLIELIKETTIGKEFYQPIQKIESNKYTYTVYHRIKEPTKDLVDSLYGAFQEKYPDDKFFQPNYALALSTIASESKSYDLWQNYFDIHGRDRIAVTVPTKGFKTYSFMVETYEANMSVTINLDGEQTEQQIVTIGKHDFEIPVDNSRILTVEISNPNNVAVHFTPTVLE
ncbi:hypothetical protein [Enterococcus sp. AZ072]|uniref:hypothetical protein n=1 Tax=unclassified Enterococcus TaxID=2608891 RepID=UPI003D2D52C9